MSFFSCKFFHNLLFYPRRQACDGCTLNASFHLNHNTLTHYKDIEISILNPEHVYVEYGHIL